MRDASDKSEEASASLKKRMEESGELELGPDDKEGSQIGRNQEGSSGISKEPEKKWRRGTGSDEVRFFSLKKRSKTLILTQFFQW